MELSVVVDAHVCRSDELQSCSSLDSVVCMQFLTPARLNITRRPSLSPGTTISDKKLKINCPLSAKFDVLSLQCVSPQSILPSSIEVHPLNPDVIEIGDPGFQPDLFDLGIRKNLTFIGVYVKPDIVSVPPDMDLCKGMEDNPVLVPCSISAVLDFASVPESISALDSISVPDVRGDPIKEGDQPGNFYGIDDDDELFDIYLPSSVPDLEDCEEDEDVDDDIVVVSCGGDLPTDAPDIVPVCLPDASVSSAIFGTAAQEDLENVRHGGVCRSAHVELWAKKAFLEWLQFCGHLTAMSIGDLSEMTDIHPLVDMLVRFMLEVKKRNGELYSTRTLSCILRGIGRLIKPRQEEQIIETSILEEKFNILTNVRYRAVKVAGDQAIAKSADAGLGCSVHKSNVITHSEEAEMLSSDAASFDHPTDLTQRFGYYSTRNFMVRGGRELCALNSNQFEVVEDKFCEECLRFTPGMTKTNCLDVLHSSSESLRLPVYYGDKDVVKTYKKLVNHWPKFDDPNLQKCHPMFLTLLNCKKYKPNAVWFARSFMGRNKLADITKNLMDGVESANGKSLSNKSGRTTGITRLNAALVPINQGMMTTGHRSHKSYEKYNQGDKMESQRAQQRVLCGEICDGVLISYTEAFSEEVERKRELQRRDSSRALALRDPAAETPLVPISSNVAICLQTNEQHRASGKENQLDTSNYAAFLEWKRLREVGSDWEMGFGSVFFNVSNCQIVVMNGDSAPNAVSQALGSRG